MILMLNEKELLRKSLEEGYIDEKKTSNTIRILAKHYFSIDMTKEQVYDSIDKFFINNYKKYNSVKWQNSFDNIINKIYKDKDYILLDINKVEITDNELSIIKSLNDIKYEKISFVLLVYAKIYNQMNTNKLGWVNVDQKYIFSDAKVVIKVKDQGILLHKLEELGLINPSKMVNCTNIKVNYIDDGSKTSIVVSDFRNFVYEYLRWKGENVSNCNNGKCKILFLPTNNRQQYCKTCWKSIRDQQNRDNFNRWYQKQKNLIT